MDFWQYQDQKDREQDKREITFCLNSLAHEISLEVRRTWKESISNKLWGTEHILEWNIEEMYLLVIWALLQYVGGVNPSLSKVLFEASDGLHEVFSKGKSESFEYIKQVTTSSLYRKWRAPSLVGVAGWPVALEDLLSYLNSQEDFTPEVFKIYLDIFYIPYYEITGYWESPEFEEMLETISS